MAIDRAQHPSVSRFLLAHAGRAARDLTIRMRRLRGGLVSASVVRVDARFVDAEGRRRAACFVVKQLGAESEREARIYELLRSMGASRLAPTVLGVERRADEATSLYLEAIAAAPRWPWRDVGNARRVLEVLADFHAQGSAPWVSLGMDAWSYESELRERAQRTLDELERKIRHTGDLRARRSLPALRRIVARLPELRERLLSRGPLPWTLLHGDLHSGNVIVRRRAGQPEPVLLDWARARIGSPFEDVSSWLQSLGFWEPAVRRKHDTLLGAYLARRGLPGPASREVRDAYWLAGASNGLAGALHYQLTVAGAPDRPSGERLAALQAAHDWLRVIRRADARLRAASSRRRRP